MSSNVLALVLATAAAVALAAYVWGPALAIALTRALSSGGWKPCPRGCGGRNKLCPGCDGSGWVRP